MDDKTIRDFTQALLAIDGPRAEEVVEGLLMERNGLPTLCDCLLAPSLHEMGRRWENGTAPVYQEHVASDVCLNLLWRIPWRLEPLGDDAPVAIGCSPEKDPYKIPTKMVEVVLRAAGWQATSFGNNLPIWSLAEAARALQPELCWISASSIEDEKEFLEHLESLRDIVAAHSTPRLVLGGRSLTPGLREKLEDDAIVVLDDMRSLYEFQEGLPRRRGV